MRNQSNKDVIIQENKKERGCLSCGATENIGRRQYCSKECRQNLKYQLELRTGLLKALDTQYATFSFTEDYLFLDLLPYSSEKVFSFLYPRTPGRKPAEDFWNMAEELGKVWWTERERTKSRYKTSEKVFEKAKKQEARERAVLPLKKDVPATIERSLTFLELPKTVVNSPDVLKVIKSAYRQQAMKHHPDKGGSEELFFKLQSNYEQLIKWVDNPTFINRRGVPGKWFYDGKDGRWRQPTLGASERNIG